ncbi:GIY-YIG nuclease family protein [Candidatus Shapirobacteria bacterium]|nr:GIY-YIG nuclease family protein [Candidatus Shapirobacteria bacterium]
MSAWIYILELNNGKFYVGSTSNIEQRFYDHSHGNSPYTRKFLPVKIVFQKEVPNMSLASTIEKKLKRYKNKNILIKIINSQNLKIAT